MKELVEARAEGKTHVEESPTGSSGSNGIVEREVQEVEGQIRALFLSLQERLGMKVDARERVVAFMPDYVTYLVNKLKVGDDGKTVYESVKGRRRV